MAKKGPFGVLRVDQDVHQKLAEVAASNGQFVSWVANKILKDWLAERETAAPGGKQQAQKKGSK